MDPEDLSRLGQRFWYAWTAALVLGSAGILLATWLFEPGRNPWLAGIQMVLALLFAEFGVISLALGEYLDAAGQAIAAIGFVVLAAGALGEFTTQHLYAGLALVGLGAGIGVLVDFGGGARSLLSR